jgi:hypothetical protein
MYLLIWHNEKHEDVSFSKVGLKPNESATDWTGNTFRKGGFWHDAVFIPWHQINYIDLETGAKS